MSLPVRQEFDDSFIINRAIYISYKGSLTNEHNKTLKKKKSWMNDKNIFTFAKPTTHKSSQIIFDKNDMTIGDSHVEIRKEEDGFYLATKTRSSCYLYITNLPYFLSKNMCIHIGNTNKPIATIEVIELSFPKIRVNFNGLRLKTKIQDNNWSNFYQINDGSEAAKLKVNQNGSSEEILLNDKQKTYTIGFGDNCDIKLKGNSIGTEYGKIKYVDDIGWVIKSLYPDDKIKDGMY